MNEEADFVIVGGGSAGCVLTNRLSADRTTQVALLEAGSEGSSLNMKVPLFFSKISADPRFGWQYIAEPEPHAGGRALPIKRGKVLGGSSAINGMAYTRGHPGDYDGWADAGATGWSYKEILPYFRRVENSWRGSSAEHGGEGPMPVARYQRDEVLFDTIAATVRAQALPLNDDFDANGADGFGCYDTTTTHGRRASAATHYLAPVRDRKNLLIMSGALATRILFDGKKAIGVEYERGGKTLSIRAKREVILAAGTYASPQLLMLSGVGPAAHLTEHGISVVADLPGVGQNLQEHPVIGFMFGVNRMVQFDRDMRLDRLALSMLRWFAFGKGLFTGVPLGAVGFFRSRLTLPRPDIEVAFVSSSFDARPWFPFVRTARGKTIWCCTWLLQPESRGHVRLRSDDPHDHPAILHNMLAEQSDVQALVAALRRLRDIAATRPLADMFESEKLPGADLQSDAELENYIRSTAVPGAHPTSTCAMGNGPDAVCDPELRVQGLESLRVIDASVMPKVVAGHSNAATLMIAERGADLVLGKVLEGATRVRQAARSRTNINQRLGQSPSVPAYP